MDVMENKEKAKGFHQPQRPHEHWHIVMAYRSTCGTFRLCAILDAYSRYAVHQEIHKSITESDMETVAPRGQKLHDARPQIISDNRPQCVVKSFKEYIRLCGIGHVSAAPHYTHRSGKIEGWNRSLKTLYIRSWTPLSLDDPRRLVDRYARYREAQ